MTGRHVVFSHGKESGPWGRKIAAMAEVARAQGYEVDSVDYRGLDAPEARVSRLVEHCRPLEGKLILAGSSMGGHVCTAASKMLRAEGLFLLAPAFYMPGYEAQTPEPADCPLEIVHGWHDDVVPLENSLRWAREHRATLHVLDSDHRLQDRIPEIATLFEFFLVRLDVRPPR